MRARNRRRRLHRLACRRCAARARRRGARRRHLVSGAARTSRDGATLHEADVRDEALVALVEELQPEVDLHLAAQADVRVSVERPEYDAEVNVLGTLRVLEAARPQGAKIVFSSTGGAIYGECDAPATEDSPRRPLAPVRHVEALRARSTSRRTTGSTGRARGAALRQRLRPAPGSARRGRRRRDLLRPPAGRAARRRSSATAQQGGTTSTSATSSAPRSRRSGWTAASTTSAPAAPRRSSSSTPLCAGRGRRVGARLRAGAPRRAAAQRARLTRAREALGWLPSDARDGLAETWGWFSA